MKIGFSFGGCLLDIVSGVVKYDDVLLIVTATNMPTVQSVRAVVHDYMSSRLRGLNHSDCLEVAECLFHDAKLHQPRVKGAQAIPFNSSYTWMDLYPTTLTNDPGLASAWEHYRVLLTLLGGPIPSAEDAPRPQNSFDPSNT
jgi:hypothetical protein